MLIETLVLNGYERMREIFGVCRDLIISFVHTVGIRILQCFEYGSILIRDVRSESLGADIIHRHSRSIIYDLFGEDHPTY